MDNKRKPIPEFCFIDIPGAIYIVRTKEPLIIGRAWLYKDDPDLRQKLAELKPLAVAEMETHSIALTLWDVLGGRLNIHAESMRELDGIMEKMLKFYVEERKVMTSKFYDKFKKSKL